MRFLLHSMVAATMLIAISAIGSKAEAAMMPSIGTLPAQTKTYTPVEKVYYRRYYRRGYYGYGRPYYGYGYRPILRLRLRLSAIWLLWLEARHNHRRRTSLGLGLLNGQRRAPGRSRSIIVVFSASRSLSSSSIMSFSSPG